MTWRERLARLDYLQNTRLFKIVASVVVVALAVAAILAYAVAINAPSESRLVIDDSAAAQVQPEEGSPEIDPAADPEAEQARVQMLEAQKNQRTNAEATVRIVNDILDAKQDPTGFGAGVAIAVGLSLVVIWVGLGLSYLAILALGVAVIAPLVFIFKLKDAAILTAGIFALTLAFTALVRLLSLVFSLPGAAFAVAKNTLAEAVRQKISLVFIVLLIFGLAALPMMLDPDQPLRYRVQSFLQYSVGGSFWLIAILVLTFATSSVCAEQRDKVIWQTMTKPVTHAQYLLGKWLGVSGLAAALLAICGAGTFMFVEYLRDQPAQGERVAYVSEEGAGLTEDRKVLEMQVLAARLTVPPEPMELDEEQFTKNIELRVQEEVARLAQIDDSSRELRFQQEQEIRDKLTSDLRRSVDIVHRSIEPTKERIYVFKGLNEAKESNRPVILRFKIDAGSNAPDVLYHLTMQFPNTFPFVESVALGQFHTLELLPTVIDADGQVLLRVQNGDSLRRRGNAETFTFAKDGLEITYSVGGYRMNFVRVMAVLWVKLAFLAMLAIAGATFLSFPVASLVAFASFIAAEGSTFLLNSLEVYNTEDDSGKMMIIPTIISWIAKSVGSTFQIYSELRPVPRLVSGLVLTWQNMAVGTTVLALMTVVLFIGAVVIFKQRELATYSGQ